MFKYIYLFVVTLSYIVATPFLLPLRFKKKYKSSIPARFFLRDNPPFTENGVHFHVCSYGEAKAIKPLVETFKDETLHFSAITATGFSVIKEYSKSIRYLPFEIFLPSWIKRQKALIVVEAELWYMLFLCSKKRGAKTFLINARVSSRSYPKYLRFKWLYKHIFANIDAVYAQSYDDAKRLVQLGAKNIHVSGNIKFLNIQKANKEYSKEYPVVVAAASTHETEEEPIVNAYLELKRVENAQLIVIPRHPERFDKVAEYLERVADKNRLSFSRFSQSGNFATDIVLVDTMGELINVYKISDIVILGGAFAEIGGHNALEAAQFGVKMISGPHYFNQVDIFNAVEGLEICESNALGEKLLNYRSLPNTKLETKASIDELVEDIRSVL